MGTLAEAKKYFKKSIMGIMLGSSLGALVGMVNFSGEVDDTTVQMAIENTLKENKDNDKLAKELNIAEEALAYEQGKLDEQAEKRFSTKYTFGIELNEKDEDGYNKIPNKVGNIEAKVSEEEALKQKSERPKDGRQKTRVDED